VYLNGHYSSVDGEGIETSKESMEEFIKRVRKRKGMKRRRKEEIGFTFFFTHLQQLPRSRKRGSVHPLPHTSS
jgi:hypothetical protein